MQPPAPLHHHHHHESHAPTTLWPLSAPSNSAATAAIRPQPR
ncbi:hypothetical protein E2C01_076922 [Portunus trituberculatus]|uniref:Uncharacterized protein n=1 Tax=Portunus trituberculatus TaxID=210409 RepID=A0A5B7IKX2_PORTR|nr:hypothetical protein [Portunus trituberculatus]